MPDSRVSVCCVPVSVCHLLCQGQQAHPSVNNVTLHFLYLVYSGMFITDAIQKSVGEDNFDMMKP